MSDFPRWLGVISGIIFEAVILIYLLEKQRQILEKNAQNRIINFFEYFAWFKQDCGKITKPFCHRVDKID